MRVDPRQESQEVTRNVDEDRKSVINACIVRIMKMRKSLSHQLLLAEVSLILLSLLIRCPGPTAAVYPLQAEGRAGQALHRPTDREGIHKEERRAEGHLRVHRLKECDTGNLFIHLLICFVNILGYDTLTFVISRYYLNWCSHPRGALFRHSFLLLLFYIIF